MPRIRYVIAAESINQSAIGKISVLGILDVMFVVAMPTTISFDIVAGFEGDDEDKGKNYGVRLWGPLEDSPRQILTNDPTGIRFPATMVGKLNPVTGCVFRFEGLPVKEFGVIKIEVEVLDATGEDEESDNKTVLDSQTIEIHIVPIEQSAIHADAELN